MRVTVKDILKKKGKSKIVSLTAYDYAFAKILDQAGVDILLVGDSVGMVCLGYDSTLPVTMREMLHHAKAVSRAAGHALVAADLPFGAVQDSAERSVRNAMRLIKEGGADAVKIEGGDRTTVEIVRKLRDSAIPVIGHLGLTPQRASELGGYKVQGRTPEAEKRMIQEACALQGAGVFAIVLECIPVSLGRKITEAVRVPTIGIGAGPHCDGQVLVVYDLLGLQDRLRPRFVRVYAPLGALAKKAVESFRRDVSSGRYPSAAESFGTGKS